jgi:hypothetical protein
MWVQWLKSDEIPQKLVKRAQKNQSLLMYLIRKVGDRQKGMGLRITKFHAITHMSHQDILHFGVPLCFDTGPDEAMHKAAKTAAKLTQKRKELFDEQVGQRMMELRTLGLARPEDGSRKLSDYYFQTGQETCQRKTMLRNTDPFGHTFGFATDDLSFNWKRSNRTQ